MPLTVSEILDKVSNGEMNTDSAAETLISILEIETDFSKRVKIINALDNIHDSNHFKHLENIVISDENENTRCEAIKNLINNYKDRALEPLMWGLKNEKSYICRVALIEALKQIGEPRVKSKISECVKEIKIKPFKKEIKKFLKNNKNPSLKNLANILINYWTIENLSQGFDWFNFKLQNGVVFELDLTDVEFKMREDIWENSINDIDDIIGLENLTSLASLKLANNNIKEIKGLGRLKELKVLDLSNNRIKKISGLDNLKKLEILNLARNEIERVEGIDHLKNLKELNLRFNKIHDPEKYDYEFFIKFS